MSENIAPPTAPLSPSSQSAARCICLVCGSTKSRPLDTCANCAHTPKTELDRAKHLLIEASDLDESAIEAVAARIRSGAEPEFSRDSLLTMTAALRADKPDPHWWLFYGLIVAIGAILTLVWLIFM